MFLLRAAQVGHWMGLYHTFQNGCTRGGDMVADTPFAAGPTTGCPAYRDSCSEPGQGALLAGCAPPAPVQSLCSACAQMHGGRLEAATVPLAAHPPAMCRRRAVAAIWHSPPARPRPLFAPADPIHNYMDYSDDVCMHQFTQLQHQRMESQFRQYRLAKK